MQISDLKHFFVWILLMILGLCSCTLAPEQRQIAVPGAEYRHFSGDKTGKPFVDGAWWESFNDETLAFLIRETLHRSPDAKHALLNIEAFRQRVIIARSPLFPSVDFSGTASRSEQRILIPPGHETKTEINQFGLLVTATYEVDLWKKIANSAEMARLALLTSEENLKIVYQTLTSNVARLYFEISELHAELPLWKELVKLTGLQARDAQRGYFSGVVDGNIYLTVQQREEKARQDLYRKSRRLSEYRFALNALMGKAPSRPLDTQNFSEFEKELPPLPAGLPSRLLNRRPDVRTAALAVRQALLQVGIRRAELLPALRLTGDGGYRSNELEKLMDGGASVWSLMGGFLQPVFHRGAKKAAVREAEIQVEMAVERYRKVALNAFREVETALSDYEALRKQLNQEQGAFRNETIVYRRIREGYLSGTRSYQEFLSARISLLSRKIIVQQLILQLLENRIRLFTVLGGGFQAFEKISGVRHG